MQHRVKLILSLDCMHPVNASPKYFEWVITQINPKVIIPVHTENKQWFADNFDGVVMLNDGDCYEC